MKIRNTKLSRLKGLVGLDFHIIATLLYRGWAVFGGGITILILPLWLSLSQQGYYFTFASVLALQVFFELGLNQIIIQLVSHEVAHLNETVDGRLDGDAAHLGRLGSLARMIESWYGVAASLFAVIGGIAGIIFFTQNGNESMASWVGVWLVLVSATALNLWLSPGLAVMEGCGKVGQVARLRLIQSITGYTLFWIALILGAGLWAATVLPLVNAAFTGYWLRVHGNIIRWLGHRSADPTHKVSWRTEVFPLQWRIALSWIGGYLIFNLFTPTVFANYGPEEAGRLGMALTIFSAISTIGMSWVNAKAPNFTVHIARNERVQLNALFKGLFIRSILVVALIAICFVAIVWYCSSIGITQVMRIAKPEILAIMAIVTIANTMIFAMAVYMRAHRKEPMLMNTLISAALITCAIVFGIKISIFFMMLMYMSIILLISLPWATWMFCKYQN